MEKRRIGADAQIIFDSAENGETVVYIPAIVFAEILYLTEKRRITTTLQELRNHMLGFPNFRECPLTQPIIETAEVITDIPELHDRLIAATARHMNLELITTDEKIRDSGFVNTVW